ncbi:hypothetical protein IT402_02070 [Candidatus Nomurabacteria bacterium]|nr:hypothetical protein [Candidatus Nomurabacteria bacterium]
MKKNNFSKGYSIIELVIYISLFVLIAIVVIQSLLYSIKTYSNARAYRTIQRNAETFLSRTTNEIRQAKNISVSASTFSSSPGVLSLTGLDSSSSPYTATISVASNVPQISISGATTSLSSSEVSVSELTFWNITTTSSDAVRIKLTLTTTRAPFITKTFYTTVVLRE